MKKISIDAKDLQDWMRDTWHLYASQWVNGNMLRLWTNGLIEYKVCYGEKTIYNGSQMTHAIAAWESV